MTTVAVAVEHLYEKCRDCHLFVEPNDAKQSPDDGLAEYIHLHRGDDADEELASHEAMPSGRKANLLAWKTYGPLAMRERFTS